MSKRRRSRTVKIRELDPSKLGPQHINDIGNGFRVMIIGGPGSGKTVLIKDLMYNWSHLFASCRAICGSAESTAQFEKLIHPLFVLDKLDIKNLEPMENLERRQKLAVRFLEKRGMSPWHMEITDDFGYKKDYFKTEYFQKKVRNSRHWRILDMIVGQTVKDLPDDCKQCSDGAFIFPVGNEKYRRLTYESFGIGVNYKEFCDLMDQLHQEEFTAMYIDLKKARTTSDKIEEIYSFYKADIHRVPENWKPCAWDYWNHGDQRMRENDENEQWS
jgi:hypothetical protein